MLRNNTNKIDLVGKILNKYLLIFSIFKKNNSIFKKNNSIFKKNNSIFKKNNNIFIYYLLFIKIIVGVGIDGPWTNPKI